MILGGHGDDAVILKFWSSLPCLSSLGYSVGYKFAFLRKCSAFQIFPDLPRSSQIFPDLPRSSQIVPASLNFVVPAMPFFSHAPGIGPGGGLYVSEMTQNGAIEFKKCSSKENGLEPRISTDAVRQCHSAKICQIRSTFFQ